MTEFNIKLDRRLDQTGVVNRDTFAKLREAYLHDSASTVGWVEAKLRVLAGRLQRGSPVQVFDPVTETLMRCKALQELRDWAAVHFPVVRLV